MQLPEPFIAQMRAILGQDADRFFAALETEAPVSVRTNPAKPVADPAMCIWANGQPIPWHPNGFYLGERPKFPLDPLWHAGAYYVQEASSMLVGEVLRQAWPEGAEAELCALDLCAAPGGKTTILLDLMPKDSLVVANEVIKSRVNVLAENLERWGHDGVAITSVEVELFAPLKGMFDVVLVDAPCSGEGLFRKDPDAVQEWSESAVQICAARQKRILSTATELVRPGGTLVYSTCTYNTQENDAQVEWMIKEHGLEHVPILLDERFGFAATRYGFSAMPHRVKGEGFYITALRKAGTDMPRKVQSGKEMKWKKMQALGKNELALVRPWIKRPDDKDFFMTSGGRVRYLPKAPKVKNCLALLDQHLPFVLAGVEMGEIKGKDFVPAHAFALSNDLADVPSIELDLEQALAFLRREDLNGDWATGWKCVRYAGLALGWVKVLPNRINNYLPAERRLRLRADGLF